MRAWLSRSCSQFPWQTLDFWIWVAAVISEVAQGTSLRSPSCSGPVVHQDAGQMRREEAKGQVSPKAGLPLGGHRSTRDPEPMMWLELHSLYC